MTKNTTSRTSSTASNNSSSDSGKRPPIFLKDIPEKYQAIYDHRDEYSPSNIGGLSEWEEWKKKIQRAHVFECLVAQNLQNMKPPAPKLEATQYWHATPSLEWNNFSLERFTPRVTYHKKHYKEEILEEVKNRIKLGATESESGSTSGSNQDEENQKQRRELRSKTLKNDPGAQKKHFEGLIIALSKGIGSAQEIKNEMKDKCKIKVTIKFCKSTLAQYRETGTFFTFDSPLNKDGRGRHSTLEKEREELLAAELNGLINIETVVCKTLIKQLAMLHYNDQEHGMEWNALTKDEKDDMMSCFDDAWYSRFCRRYGFENNKVKGNDAMRNSATNEKSFREYFDRVGRTAVAHGMGVWNKDFNVTKKNDFLIPRGGRKRVTNNEVKVVDDDVDGDDDATEKRRSKRSRNK